MNIQRLKTYLDADFLTEAVLLFLKDNMKKIIFAFGIFLVCLFGIMYGVHKKHEARQQLVQKYIIAQSKVAQKENTVALQMFQEVYNNAKGVLEVMALMSVIDLLIQDKQYETVKTLLADIPTLQQKSATFILLYSKALNVTFELVKQKSISLEEKKVLFGSFAKHLNKIRVPKEFAAHKQTLLFSFGGDLPKDFSKLPENELTEALKIIQENTK